MDTIFLRGFEVKTLIGLYEWERQQQQTLLLDLEVALPNSLASGSDNIDDTISYAELAQKIRDSLASCDFLLLEALAEHVADIALRDFNSPWIKLSVTKLGILDGVAAVGLTIERSQ